MALDLIAYDIKEQTPELDQLNNLFYIDRIEVEANTRGTTVTATLLLENTEVAAATFSSTARDRIALAIDRIGAFSQLRLAPAAGIQWYGNVSCVVRPLTLGVKIVGAGNRINFPGRSDDLSTFIVWDINPFSLPADARNTPLMIRRAFLDVVTGTASITPVITNKNGAQTTLPAVTQATRNVVSFPVLDPNQISSFQLNGDFTDSQIVVYDVELDMYNPNARQLAVG